MPSDSDVSSNIEIERQFRVVDQMLSIHSILRDRYLRRSRVLQYTLLVIAILLNAVVADYTCILRSESQQGLDRAAQIDPARGYEDHQVHGGIRQPDQPELELQRHKRRDLQRLLE